MKNVRRGTKLGKYKMVRRLGEGASAEVWLAQDTVQARKVAVKIVLPSVVEAFGREATEHEARVAARLDHPNIVPLRNADWHAGLFVMVSDPAIRSLDGYGAAKRSTRLALKIVHDVARGLAYAHGRRVLHRDIKPANILLYADKQAKLGDFGTARFAPSATQFQTEVGTQGYMAPEQAYGRPKFASDVFSLGLVAYELLTGVLPSWPFSWPNDGFDKLEQRVGKPIQNVIRKALEIDVAKRWTDGGEFLEAFERALKAEQPLAKTKPTKRPRRRSRTVRSPFEHETRWFRRNHGSALRLEFDCCSCDGPISESMKACPWCGTDRNSFREITRFPLVCPDCERGVRPEWNACPWCFTGRFESNGDKVPIDARAERTCRTRGCKGQLRPFMRYCPQCKTKVERPWKVAGLSPCKRCRWPTSDRWRFCPWCSRRQRDSLRI